MVNLLHNARVEGGLTTRHEMHEYSTVSGRRGADWSRDFAVFLLLERVTFVTGEHLDRYPVGYGGCTVDYPVIQKPFELNALASYIDSAGSRARA